MGDTRPKWRGVLARSFFELAIIGLEVLIALWADGSVARRPDRRIEVSRVAALGDNVTASRIRLGDAMEEAKAAHEALTVHGGHWAVPDPGRSHGKAG